MRVFRMNDCDWYMARSLDEARSAILRDYYGSTHVDDRKARDEGIVDEPHEVSDEDMHRLRFAVRLAEEVAKDPVTARIFASTEY